LRPKYLGDITESQFSELGVARLGRLRGDKPKVISEVLGHASVAFTMDTYSHIISGMQEDMMVLLDEVLPSGVPQASNERHVGQLHDSMPA